ncbi:protein MLP1 isoform X2 [Venturia canescens]|uniref:protein MLP1 isoform X2 n=1 Tax=Venturia canescens TaxID=32260 RepID=UPI001C9C2793|nr:protein MLP1 isoform X2 [Venturia canescens]
MKPNIGTCNGNCTQSYVLSCSDFSKYPRIMEATNGQLQTKYQKIATEYSKIRAQANVLKKAVIDEQVRNVEIREQLKEKDVELRKAEQELDSLTFRNQQLTKRVTFLQEELDHVQNKSKKGRSKSTENKDPQVAQPNHIYVEEFQKKIMENAQLLSQIADKEGEIESLNERIIHLEYKLRQSEKSKIELDSKYQERVDKLEREKNDVQRKLAEKQKQEETTSWSSVEGTDCKVSLNNHRQNDQSPFSSPSVSRRSSKSLGDPRTAKITGTDDESRDEFEFVKLADLEKELNQWKADYHILKIKYDEMQQKEASETSQLAKSLLEPVEISNMLGRLNAPFTIPEEIETREAKIRDYFLREIDKLITEKHICHVENLAIAANNEVLNVHLETSESKREKCETALHETMLNWTSLQEDREVREGNYKSQLSTMSEHLANMNEKLIRQTEEIQQLKFELSNKNVKKGKQK